jgi:hypothetical protein
LDIRKANDLETLNFYYVFLFTLIFPLKMSSRKRPISKDRLDRNKGVLSESIVQYYLKHGQNRDLEKYLRLRSSRSSSDSSLPQHPADFIADRVHKSLENLNKLKDELSDRGKIGSGEKSPKQSEKSGENIESEIDGDEKSKSKENIDKTNNIKVSVKQQSDNKSENKKNPFNFNVESVIEISVPQLQAQNPLPLPAPATVSEIVPSTSKEVISYSCPTQTQQNQATSFDLESSNVETPIKPIVKAQKAKRSLRDNIENISPTSSVLSHSNKQKLEWDSLGDVGYDLGHDINQKYSLFNPNDSEKRALQTYFNQRGINFEDKVVLITNKDKLKSVQDQEAEKLDEIRKNKDRWQKIYEKYKEKYQKPQLEFSPEAQSTPRLPELETPEPKEMEPKNKDEKSSQTSLIKNIAKSTQVEVLETPPALPPRNPKKKLKHIKEINSVLELFDSSGLYEENSPVKRGVEVAESFVFIAGSSQEKSESGVTQFTTTDTSRTASSIGGQKTEISTFDEELKIAITLLNSLLESRNMNPDLKKSLASKIIQKIIRIQSSKSIQTSTSNNEYESSSHIYSEAQVSSNPSSSRRTSFFSNSSASKTEIHKILPGKKESKEKKEESDDGVFVFKAPDPPKHKGKSDAVEKKKRPPKLKEMAKKSSKTRESHSKNSQDGEVKPTERSKSREASNSSADRPESPVNSRTYSRSSQRTPQKTYSISNHSQNTTEASSILENPPSKNDSQDNSKNSNRSRSSSESRKKALQDFLKPMTHSEFDYQNQKKLERMRKEKERKKLESQSQKTGSQLVEFLKEEKKSQLNWIEREIDHLNNLRDLLAKNGDVSSKNTTMKSSVLESTGKSEFEKSGNSTKEKRLYENLGGSKKKEVVQEKLEKSSPALSSSKNSTTNHEETSTKDSSLEKKPGPKEKHFRDWDSHTNMKKIMKNRSKLETPTSERDDESLASFINKRKDIFIEKYERRQEKVYSKEDEEDLYTKPYNSQDEAGNGHYSEPNEQRPPVIQRRVISQYLEQKNTPPLNGSTSLNSSEIFISSDSISIPIVNSNSQSTNSYNNREKKSIHRRIIGTQTTDSISKTKPIFENKIEASCETLSHTKLIDQTKNHKQMQTHPKSIKYTLTFERKARSSEIHKFSSLPQKFTSVLTEKNSKEILNRMNSNSLDNRSSGEKQEVLEQVAEAEENLGKCLNQKRPDVWRKFEERRQCIRELRRLR